MLDPFGVQVADGDDARDIMREDAPHIHVVRDAAAADLADLNLVAGGVCAEDRGRNDGGHDRQARRAGEGGFEEMASGEVEV